MRFFLEAARRTRFTREAGTPGRQTLTPGAGVSTRRGTTRAIFVCDRNAAGALGSDGLRAPLAGFLLSKQAMYGVSLTGLIRNSRLSLLWLAATTGCSESDESCTLVGCSDGFSIHMVADEPLRDGTYDVALTLDGVTSTCRHVVGAAEPVPPPSCSSGPIRSNLSIHNGGAAPNREVPNGIVVDMAATPAVVVLEVRHDGSLIAEQTYNPTYQTIAPNGPECGPICDVAPFQQVTLSYD